MLNRLKRERILFSLGCIAIAIAVLSVTIAPYLINNFAPNIFASMGKFQNFSFIFYGIAIFCYLFSQKYQKLQIKWILIAFAYFILFQILVKIISP